MTTKLKRFVLTTGEYCRYSLELDAPSKEVALLVGQQLLDKVHPEDAEWETVSNERDGLEAEEVAS